MSASITLDEKLQGALWTLNTVGHKGSDWASPQDMRDTILALDQLPPLPEIAHRLLSLRGDPLCDAQKLAAVISLDPNLSTQVVRWASSPFYGFRAKTVTVRDAITIVLGFDAVFNLAFGLCALSPLQVPVEGPLGKRFFWRQTLAGAGLIQKLAQLMDSAERPPLSQLNLIYLLHNTGHMLLAHLFQPQFNYLVRLLMANPDNDMLAVERYALGTDHATLGAWLMQGWQMPKSLQEVCLHHHNPCYRGPDERLVWLVCLADRQLGRLGIGDSTASDSDEASLCANLRIDPAKAEQALQQLADKMDELEQTVATLLER
jgi:HD-like signal output (HDOD) protein